MEDQGGLVNLIVKIRFGSTIECVWPKLESGEEFLGRTRWKFAFRADGADGQILLGQTFAKLL